MSTATEALPAPLVKLTQNTKQWLINQLILVAFAVVFANIGMYIAAAVYYIAFQWWSPITWIWHKMLWSSRLRHAFRNVMEGLLGGHLAQQITWNHYKKKRKPLLRFEGERFKLADPTDDVRLRFRQMLIGGFASIFYAVPGFLAMYLAVRWANHSPTVQHFFGATVRGYIDPHAHWLWNYLKQAWSGNWDQKLMGYAAAFFFGRRPVKGVFDDLQLWFVERRIARAKSSVPRWYPPAYKARYNDVLARYTAGETDLAPRQHTGWRGALMLGVIGTFEVLGIVLAIYGVYILNFIAG